MLCQVVTNASKKINKGQGTENGEGQLFKERWTGKLSLGDTDHSLNEVRVHAHTSNGEKNLLDRENNVYKVQEAGMSSVSSGVVACVD